MPLDYRRTRAWRKLRDKVVEEEPECRLQYPGICTGASETADHIDPVKTHPHLAMTRTNLRGACHPCNRHRLARTDAEVAAAHARGDTPTPARPRALDIFKPL
jgi:5-methylcytosine-specific restriction endonuclease McrA